MIRTAIVTLFVSLACSSSGSPSSSDPPEPPEAPPLRVPAALRAQELPERLSIRSVQSAWHVTQETFSITRQAGGFAAGDRVIDEGLVRALLQAAAAPREPEVNPDRIKPLLGDLRPELERAKLLPSVAQRFAERALEPANMAQILRRIAASRITDDYPAVQVELAWANGDHIALRSTSQDPLMLPWNADDGVTWNPDISVAVAALMPDGFLNSGRVAGTALTRVFAGEARGLFAAEIGIQEARERYGAQLEPLERRFRIEGGTVAGRFRFNTHAAHEAWCGELFRVEDAPFGFSLCLSAKQSLASHEPFLRDADVLLARVRKVPWLSRFAAENPQARILIEYRDDTSVTPYARASILESLRRHEDQPQLAAELEPVLAEGIGVRIEHGKESGVWLVLPDARGLFFYGTSFGAAATDLRGGSVIQPDGTGGVRSPKLSAYPRVDPEFQKRAEEITRSVRSSFEKTRKAEQDGTLLERAKRALWAPFAPVSSETKPDDASR